MNKFKKSKVLCCITSKHAPRRVCGKCNTHAHIHILYIIWAVTLLADVGRAEPKAITLCMFITNIHIFNEKEWEREKYEQNCGKQKRIDLDAVTQIPQDILGHTNKKKTTTIEEGKQGGADMQNGVLPRIWILWRWTQIPKLVHSRRLIKLLLQNYRHTASMSLYILHRWRKYFLSPTLLQTTCSNMWSRTKVPKSIYHMCVIWKSDMTAWYCFNNPKTFGFHVRCGLGYCEIFCWIRVLV